MELKIIFTNIEPSNKNVLWLSVVGGEPVLKIYTAKGWQIIGSPSAAKVALTSLYDEYKAQGGIKTKEEFNNELFNLIG